VGVRVDVLISSCRDATPAPPMAMLRPCAMLDVPVRCKIDTNGAKKMCASGRGALVFSCDTLLDSSCSDCWFHILTDAGWRIAIGLTQKKGQGTSLNLDETSLTSVVRRPVGRRELGRGRG